MAPWLQSLIQGLAGVAVIVLAFVVLKGPEAEVARTAVTGFGFALLGNLVKGPGQVSVAEADRRVARATSDPPPRP
jgi:hypothetical protein